MWLNCRRWGDKWFTSVPCSCCVWVCFNKNNWLCASNFSVSWLLVTVHMWGKNLVKHTRPLPVETSNTFSACWGPLEEFGTSQKNYTFLPSLWTSSFSKASIEKIYIYESVSGTIYDIRRRADRQPPPWISLTAVEIGESPASRAAVLNKQTPSALIMSVDFSPIYTHCLLIQYFIKLS